ncbi:MAG TPA: ribosome small subunit-dependent GTPase A [Spirochaetaceae bacterium]|jgi:ribosome biogenesis GTPase|nr:ribosome small subunit-dependent GTPase A [Spirochaetaceae bacterium]
MYIVYEHHRDAGAAQRDPLADWGWDEFFSAAFDALGASPEARSALENIEQEQAPAGQSGGEGGALEGRRERARVIEVQRGAYLVIRQGPDYEAIEDRAILSGKARLLIEAGAEAPAVGDWVLGRKELNGPFVIEGLLPRKSSFSRKAAGDVEHDSVREQVLAANVDIAFLVAAAGEDFNERRLERYATLAWESGAMPVIVITKADLAGDGILELVARASAACPGVPAFAICAPDGKGLAAFDQYLKPGKTGVLLGSSGAGKSTLLNALAGVRLAATNDVRAFDQHGRHTTTARTLYRLQSGALIIDTPGLREIQLWASEESVDAVFSEIEEAARGCRFADCSHGEEPGCAVKEGLENGVIAIERYESWLRLRRELSFLETKHDPLARQAEKTMLKRRSKYIRELKKSRD